MDAEVRSGRRVGLRGVRSREESRRGRSSLGQRRRRAGVTVGTVHVQHPTGGSGARGQ